VTVRTTPIDGVYYRVADPDWADALDPSFAAARAGQRWNPAGLPCLYLNRDESTARANVARRFVGLPYGPTDLDPATAPLLVEVDLPAGVAADAATDEGLVDLGLPTTYPLDRHGQPVPHATCQPIGRRVFDVGLDGIDCRSAAPGGGRELAWFPRDAAAIERRRRPFDEWW
jgi:hypothetical protein